MTMIPTEQCICFKTVLLKNIWKELDKSTPGKPDLVGQACNPRSLGGRWITSYRMSSRTIW